MTKLNIYLHHRDLRYNDNTSMIKQMKNNEHVTPIFIFEPIQIDPTKNNYFSNGLVQFMIESLEDYKKTLKKKEGELYYFYGNTLSVLEYIHSKIGINSIGFNYEYSPFGKKRDSDIIEFAKKEDITIYCEEDILLFNIIGGQTLNPNNNRPYLVFTPYYNNLINNLKVTPINKFNKFKFHKSTELKNIKYAFDDLNSLYTVNKNLNVHGGRTLALKILKNINKFNKYEENRDMLSYKTTMLSAYINFNVISIREIYTKIVNTFDKHHGLIRELIFRDYYHTMIHYFPHVIHSNFYPKFDKIEWNTDVKQFNAWKAGKTGYPLIDAAMTQLNTTNYMHNRMRMLVASFLIKNLQIDWRKGEKYFAQNLEDYNIYNNWGGWTNIADMAPSAQSYFRVFSPEAHSRKYDPECVYTKQWLPHLKDIPNEDIHSWDITTYKKYNIHYPPIVNFNKSREDFIKFYKKYV